MKYTYWIGAVSGILILLIFLVVPPFEPLTPAGMKAVGVFLFTIVWWTTVGVGFTSLLCIALLATTGVMTPAEAFACSMGNWVVLFLFGCFGISEGLRVTGFSRRFAFWFMGLPFAAGRPWVLMSMFLLACTLMGAVMSSTATCIVFMSIAKPMVEALGYKKGDDFAAMLMIGIAWASTASLSMTPIASAGNVMMMAWIERDLSYGIDFLQWMAFGIPMGLLVYLLILGVFRYAVRPDMKKFSEMKDHYVQREIERLGPITIEEKLALLIFSGVVACWILPDFTAQFLPESSGYLKNLGYAIPALVGSCLLCLIRIHDKPLLDFNVWMIEGMEWGSTLLVAAIMALGAVLGNKETGINEFLATIIRPVASQLPLYLFIFIGLLWVVIQTNVMSNLVSMTLVYNVMMPISVTEGLGNPVALGATIAAASCYAFSLPSATTSTAIVVGSGWVSVQFLSRYGVLLILPIVLLFTFVCYPFAVFIFG